MYYRYIYIICMHIYIYIQSLRAFRLARLRGLLEALGLAERSLRKTRTSWNSVCGVLELSWGSLVGYHPCLIMHRMWGGHLMHRALSVH